MKRRDLLRTLGASSVLALVPHDAIAAWARVASGLLPAVGLSEDHLALVGAIADTILPRTDSPSATDVGVPAFINVIVGENYSDEDRAAFAAGLDAFDAAAKKGAGAAFVDLIPDKRALTISQMEDATDRRAEPSRTYWRLKGLIIHGYFTSEPVMKNVLHIEVMPGRFDGSAPMPNA